MGGAHSSCEFCNTCQRLTDFSRVLPRRRKACLNESRQDNGTRRFCIELLFWLSKQCETKAWFLIRSTCQRKSSTERNRKWLSKNQYRYNLAIVLLTSWLCLLSFSKMTASTGAVGLMSASKHECVCFVLDMGPERLWRNSTNNTSVWNKTRALTILERYRNFSNLPITHWLHPV